MAEDRLVAGQSPSAEEFEDRVDKLQDQHEHGSSEGKPDPATAETASEGSGGQGQYINAAESEASEGSES
jgi:hypothetical protein